MNKLFQPQQASLLIRIKCYRYLLLLEMCKILTEHFHMQILLHWFFYFLFLNIIEDSLFDNFEIVGLVALIVYKITVLILLEF